MSGGHFEYKQYQLNELAEEVKRLIESNDSDESDGYGGVRGKHYPSHIIDEFKQGVKMLRRAEAYVQRIDWLVSGDDGEDNFQKRLFEDLSKIND